MAMATNDLVTEYIRCGVCAVKGAQYFSKKISSPRIMSTLCMRISFFSSTCMNCARASTGKATRSGVACLIMEEPPPNMDSR